MFRIHLSPLRIQDPDQIIFTADPGSGSKLNESLLIVRMSSNIVCLHSRFYGCGIKYSRSGWYSLEWYILGWYILGWYSSGWYILVWYSLEWYILGWYSSGWHSGVVYFRVV